jgi:O-antigen/teichoic acid export membrane protein
MINGADGAMLSKLVRVSRRAIEAYGEAIIAIGIRGGSVLAGATLTWLISRQYGAEANGQFALVVQTGQFLSVIGLVGLDIAVVRHFSAARAAQAPLSRRVLLVTSGVALAFLTFSAIFLALNRELIAESIFANSIPKDFIFFSSAILVGRGGARYIGAVLRSQGAYVVGQAVEAFLIPTATVLVCSILFFLGFLRFETILWVTAALGIIIMLGSFPICLAQTSRGRNLTSPALRTLMASAVPMWGVGILSVVGDWYGLVVAANLLGPTEVGYYRVAVQVTISLQVISMALFSVYAPKISASFHKSDLRSVGALTRNATILSAVFTIPLAFTIVLFAEAILAFFGPEFISAAPTLRVLVFGQMALTLTGPCGITMAMAGYERTNLIFNIGAALLLFIIVPFATRHLNIIGLAASLSIVLLFRHLAAVLWLRWKVGLNVITGVIHSV